MQELPDIRETADLRALLDRQECQVQRVHRAYQANPAHRGHKGRLARQVLGARLAPLVWQIRRALIEIGEIKGSPAPQRLPALLVQQIKLVLLARTVRRGLRVLRERQVLLDRLAPLGPLP
ncbi:hypothetical protein MOX02_60420 [Methylobacterium oxalidis]|uniref:Uncharacterized protein n=1 Tax=Methylobacterium oxalidis TaxID=944322 RepID=A0A512JDH0_9HYPH|nr:hypothetical protein MOX02_60420 [Methylobacterium oxalidis]GLS62486.1 hypothetical protein GCM10007888_08670 [Methylobacterium oxalidis]